MSHRCPAEVCQLEVDDAQLACSRHWFSVSSATRTQVWRTWRQGAGQGSPEHTAAVRAAIDEMNGRCT